MIAPGVTVGGVAVGGMSRRRGEDGRAERRRTSRSSVEVGKRSFRSSPGGIGAVPQIKSAIKRALEASPGQRRFRSASPSGQGLTRAYVAKLAKRFDHAAVDSVLQLRNNKPWITKSVPGKKIDRARSVKLLVTAL